MIEFLRKNQNWEQANYVGLYTLQSRVGETYSMGTGQSKTEAKEEAGVGEEAEEANLNTFKVPTVPLFPTMELLHAPSKFNC